MALEKRILNIPISGSSSGDVEARAKGPGIASAVNAVFTRAGACRRRNSIDASGMSRGYDTGMMDIDGSAVTVASLVAQSKTSSPRLGADTGGSDLTAQFLCEGSLPALPLPLSIDLGRSLSPVFTSSMSDIMWAECIANDSRIVITYHSLDGGVATSRHLAIYSRDGKSLIWDFSPATAVSPNIPYAGLRLVRTNKSGRLYAFYNDAGVVRWMTMDTPIASIVNGSLASATPSAATPLAVCCLHDDVVGIAYVRAAGNQICFSVIDMTAPGYVEAGPYTSATTTSPISFDVCRWRAGDDEGCLLMWTAAAALSYVVLSDAAAVVYPVVTSSFAGYPATTARVSVVEKPNYSTPGSGGAFASVELLGAASALPYIQHFIVAEAAGALSIGVPVKTSYMQTIASSSYVPYAIDLDATGLPLLPITYFQGGDWTSTYPTSSTIIDRSTAQRHYYVGNHAIMMGAGGLNHASDPPPQETYYTAGRRMVPKTFYATNDGLSTYDPACATALACLPRYNYGGSRSLVIAEMGMATKVKSLTINGVVHTPALGAGAYDGTYMNFPVPSEYPEVVSISRGGAGTGTFTAGTYAYRFVYEYLNQRGDIIQSAPSLAFTQDVAAADLTKSIILGVHPYQQSGVYIPYSISVYRTEVNGSVYYKIGEVRSTPGVALVSYTDAGGQSLTTTTADGVVPVRPTLYTYGGILENVCPQWHDTFCVHQNRYFYVDSTASYSDIYYSRQIQSGQGIPFSDVLKIQVPADGGKITALESHAGNLIVFKSDRIYAVSGMGPDDTGGGAQYSQPALISAGAGCAAWSAVTRIPDGLAFVSQRGIKLLDRSLAVVPIGDPVRTWTDANDYNCCVTYAEERFAIFTTPTNGPALCYFYDVGAWSPWTGYFTIYDGTPAGYKDRFIEWCSVAGGSLWFGSSLDMTQSAGVIRSVSADRVYNRASWDSDAGGFIDYKMAAATTWLAPAGVGRKFRAYKYEAHAYTPTGTKLSARIGYNYDPILYDGQVLGVKSRGTAGAQENFSHSEYDDPTITSSPESYNNAAVIAQFKGSRQRVRAVRIEISEEADGVAPRGPVEFAGITLVYGDAGIANVKDTGKAE